MCAGQGESVSPCPLRSTGLPQLGTGQRLPGSGAAHLLGLGSGWLCWWNSLLSPPSAVGQWAQDSAFVLSLLDLLSPQTVLPGEGELSQPGVEGCAHEAVWCRVGNSPPSLFGKMAKLSNL